jgi:hypothetical protein
VLFECKGSIKYDEDGYALVLGVTASTIETAQRLWFSKLKEEIKI